MVDYAVAIDGIIIRCSDLGVGIVSGIGIEIGNRIRCGKLSQWKPINRKQINNESVHFYGGVLITIR